MKTAADWCRRKQLLLGSEKDTGRTLDWTSGVLVTVDVVKPLLAAGAVVLLRMEEVGARLVADVGMLLGVMGLFK